MDEEERKITTDDFYSNAGCLAGFGRLLQSIAPTCFVIVMILNFTVEWAFILPMIIWLGIMFYTIANHGKNRFFSILKNNIIIVVGAFVLFILIPNIWEWIFSP